ncbi:unnamed protein product [Candidula unifasciata]|uniref:Alpha-galactosidase n=1 Tax=Candidula unifasciata TaxID=100452 RepID=A0A8S3YHP9_9EUPU|nr:unnamed protein product [Candidula unifasciata]
MIAKLCMITLGCSFAQALNNGLALTPIMGWMSWERYSCNFDCLNDPDNCISEGLYKKMADLLVSEGYKDAGYQYLHIDVCWPVEKRDSNGKLVADPARFPSGIQAIAKYVHSKGLKLGIYADFSYETCPGYPGSEYYMDMDAKTFAEWEIDSLRYNGCDSKPKEMPYVYPLMSRALNMTGRSIVYICQWPGYYGGVGVKPDYAALREACNQWRNYHEIQNSWESVGDVIDHYGNDKGNFSQFAGPGGWNDPDVLVVGDYGLSYYQQKAQFGMWALFASPLMMSLDLRSVDPAAKQLLLNKNIIAINQDPLGNQAVRLFKVSTFITVWIKKLARKGAFAIGVLNRGSQGTPYKTSLSDLGLRNKHGYQLWEAFENKTIGSFSLTKEFVVNIEPTSIYIIIAIPK